jgi:hypothetical protein
MEANPGAKHRAQNLAISYATQRRNRKAKGGVVSFGADRHPHDKGMYAQGGMAEMPEPIIQSVGKELYLDEDEKKSKAEAAHDGKSMFKMADGGAVDSKGNKSQSLTSSGPIPTPPQPTGMDQLAGSIKQAFKYSGGQILKEEMPDEIDPRAGHEAAMDRDEDASDAEQMRDKSMKMARGGMYGRKLMASGGFAEPEYPDAGKLGFPMMEQENDPDEYSKDGIINYAHGGMAADEMTEPTEQRLGEEPYLDDMEYPMSYHGAGQGEHEAGRSFAQENPSIADSIRRKYMASGGMASNPEFKNKPLDQNAIEHTNYMYKLNRQLGDHEMYSEMDALDDVSENEHERDDGGQDSRDIPMDRYDMVDEIRRKYAKNRAI